MMSSAQKVALAPSERLAERELRKLERAVAAPPPSSDRGSLSSRAFHHEFAEASLSLSVRLLVVDSIAGMLPGEGEDLAFFTAASAVTALREALDDVCGRLKDRRFDRFVSPSAPLAAYVRGLYLRSAAMAEALETYGFGALEERRHERTLLRALQEASEFYLPDLESSIQRDLALARLELGQAVVRAVRDSVERLFAVSAGLDAGTTEANASL